MVIRRSRQLSCHEWSVFILVGANVLLTFGLYLVSTEWAEAKQRLALRLLVGVYCTSFLLVEVWLWHLDWRKVKYWAQLQHRRVVGASQSDEVSTLVALFIDAPSSDLSRIVPLARHYGPDHCAHNARVLRRLLRLADAESRPDLSKSIEKFEKGAESIWGATFHIAEYRRLHSELWRIASGAEKATN